MLHDEASKHFPDRIEIELHDDAHNVAHSTGFSIPLYRNGRSIWRHGEDSAGDIDVAVIELERAALPAHTDLHALHRPLTFLAPSTRSRWGVHCW